MEINFHNKMEISQFIKTSPFSVEPLFSTLSSPITMPRLIPFLHLLGASLLLSLPASAAEYFVSPSGNDANPGTQNQPFQTLGKAAAVANAGDTCWLREGVYREVLQPKNSGQEGKPITFQAWENEKVVFSGLDPVTGWKAEANTSIWEAPMTWDLKDKNQVFCGGQMMFEARWPHKTTNDPMKPEGAAVVVNSGKDLKSFVCATLPDFPADVWQGTTVWMLADRQWSSWTAPLTGYTPSEKRLFYAPIPGKDYKWWVSTMHLPGGGMKNVSTFYISGNRGLLGAPGEWYDDAPNQKLLVIPPAGSEADFADKIEAKHRDKAVDFSGLSYITLSGVEIMGATLNLKDASHCVVEKVKASYICHGRGGATINALPQGEGIVISGEDNLLRDSEIGWSAGSGVTIQGKHNRIVNCYIHDCDYFGSYNKPVGVEGEENLLSHCTIARAGRDCVQPIGHNNRIEYNDISQAGLICQDLAMVYSAGRDGGNTEISYNWVHDAPKPMSSGIYVDNYSRDYIIHHNVVWSTSSDSMAMNRPSDYNLILNNTFYNSLGSKWGPWKNPITMPGCRVINNVSTHLITVKPEVQLEANVQNADLGPMHPEEIPQPHIPQEPGVALDGITPPEAGDHPSIGAYQEGMPRWKAGWDPNAHPDAVFNEVQTPLRNLLSNSSFDFDGGKMDPWQNSPGSDAMTEHFDGFNFPPAEARNAIQNFSLHFPTGKGEVFQVVKDLPAGKPLILAGYVRGFDQADVSMRFEDADGKSCSVAFPAKGDWVYMTIPIPARADRTTGKVVITKAGGGDAYVDNLGLSIDGL